MIAKNFKTRQLGPEIILPPISKHSLILQQPPVSKSYQPTRRGNHSIKVSIPLMNMINDRKRSQGNSISKEIPHRTNRNSTHDSKRPRKTKRKAIKKFESYMGPETIEQSNGVSLSIDPQISNRIATETIINQQSDCFDEIEMNGDTLLNFRKKIQQNRAFIRNQKVKRNKQGTFKVTEKINLPQKRYNNRKRGSEDSNYTADLQCYRPKVSQSDLNLFSNLQKLIDNKLTKQTDTTIASQEQNRSQQKAKVSKMIQKIRKMSPKQSSHRIQDQACQKPSPTRLKNQQNYSQWRKINISNQDLQYHESSFQLQHGKISDFIEKNESSLAFYLESKKQLLKLGLRFHTEQTHNN